MVSIGGPTPYDSLSVHSKRDGTRERDVSGRALTGYIASGLLSVVTSRLLQASIKRQVSSGSSPDWFVSRCAG